MELPKLGSAQTSTVSDSKAYSDVDQRSTTQFSDDVYLRRHGKKPTLRRSFGFMSILGFSCASLISWESVPVSSVQALVGGGPGAVIWGLLINWIGTLSTFIVIAELASMCPTAGGQYHWVAMMAPPKWKAFLSYLTGWLTTLAWQSLACSASFLIATWLQGIILMSGANYMPQNWHTVLISWAVSGFAVTINSTTGKFLAKFEGLVLVLHLVGFFCVMIPLIYLGPHGDASAIFTTFLDNGGWNSKTLTFLVSLPITAVCLLGADSAVHMSEEIVSAASVVPQALVYSVLINGSLALAMAIALVFCMGDIEAALEAQMTMIYPALEIFLQAVKSKTGAILMASIVLVLATACGVGAYATASRMIWSFSRDKGLPFSGTLVKVPTKLSKTALPTNAVFTTLAITMLLSLISLGSTVALNDILTLSVAALYSSYLIVCALLLWRRLSGCVHHPAEELLLQHSGKLYWGPWRVPEPWGSINNVYACCHLTFLFFWCFWPPMTPVTPETANYSVLLLGSVIIGSVLWYYLRARKYFQGPIREVEIEAPMH
ncbi:amino acid/polyamine transporter I [Clohesyomyces aquaticus]|uniref:Amino acid/polyamine transporter I n=1 Tax=Clohesyomyces aquaticus TaxID=1231657 RepID=A0A1Y1YW97_9PLEO|nr:amino acid/polyamine transporter I [Clohesyomyces aquaticus]